MTTLSINQGTLNLPGVDSTSKKVVQELLAKDHDAHHCYSNAKGFHNHLSHHLLAGYDLGASAELLKAIYERDEKMQRPIMLDNDETVPTPGAINKANWTKYLGEEK
jgi:Questin oxidase-like